jgi:hypothetical protein
MAANVGDGGGAVTVGWTFGFIDNGKDVSTMIWEGLDSTGTTVLKTTTATLTGTAGLASGTIQATGIFPTATPGTYPWRMRVADVAGNQSNNLGGTWTVTAIPGVAGAVVRDEPVLTVEGMVIPN